MTRQTVNTGYTVGRGKPPVHTRFQPGQSGNPRGRPKGAKNLRTILDDALSERVVVIENGKKLSLSKVEIIVRQLVNNAAKGNIKHTTLVLKQVADSSCETDGTATEPIFSGEDDKQLLAELIAAIGASPDRSGDDQ